MTMFQVRQYRDDWAKSKTVGRLYVSEKNARAAVRRDPVLRPGPWGADPCVRIVRVEWDPDAGWRAPGCTCWPRVDRWSCPTCLSAGTPVTMGESI